MPALLFVELSTLDIANAVDRYPDDDTKAQASDQFLGAGGPAVNAAVACAIVLDAARIQAGYTTELGEHVEDASIALMDDNHPDLAVNIARQPGKRGTDRVGGCWKPIHDRLLPLTDISILSTVFTPPGFRGDRRELLDHIQAAGPKYAAVTCGPDPILFAVDGHRIS